MNNHKLAVNLEEDLDDSLERIHNVVVNYIEEQGKIVNLSNNAIVENVEEELNDLKYEATRKNDEGIETALNSIILQCILALNCLQLRNSDI